MSTYEPIMQALLAQLQAQIATNTFYTFQRGILIWEQLIALQNAQPTTASMRQPALFLYDGVGFGGGMTRYVHKFRGTPPVRVITRTIVLYAREPSVASQPSGFIGGPVIPTTGGGSIFHPLIEAVENAFQATDSEGALTLGGLVSHCWLEGEGMLVSPDIDPNGQGMATLPVSIMIP